MHQGDDKEGRPERLGEELGEVEDPANGGDEGPEGGAALQQALLQGDDEGAFTESLDEADGEVEGPIDGSDGRLEEGQ